MLNDHGGHVLAQTVAAAGLVREREHLHLEVLAGAVRAQRLDVSGIDAPADQHARSLRRAHGHVHGLDQRRRPVVQGRVRDLQAREIADHRLVLEQRLQDALRQLGLVWRVRGVQLGAARQCPHDRRHVVVVGTPTGEADQVVRAAVLRRHPAHVRDQLHLREPLGDGQLLVQRHVLRQMGEQIFN